MRNTVYLTLASSLQKVIAFLYFAYLSNYFGASETGAYFVALGIVTTLAVFEDIGLTSVLIREIAKRDFEPGVWLRRVMGVKLITIPLLLMVAWFGMNFLPEGMRPEASVVLYVRLGVGLLIADTLSLSFYGVLRGKKQLKYESWGIFIGQMVTAVFGGVLMLMDVATMPLIILALTLGSVWNLGFSLWHVGRQFGWRGFVPSFEGSWKMARMALAFFIGAFFVKLMSYFDSYLLMLFNGSATVGQYAVAYKFTYAFQFLPLVFVAALYPEMSEREATGERLKRITLDSFWYMMFLGAPIVFGLWATAPKIIDTFYRMEEYGGAVIILQVLVFVLFSIFLDFPLGSLLNAKDRHVAKTVITGISLVVNVVANIILIPLYGGVGAGISALITFVVMLILDAYIARSIVVISLKEVLSAIGPVLLAGCIMGIMVRMLLVALPLPVLVIVGAVAYLTVAWLLGGIGAHHVRQLKSLIYGKE